MFPSFFSFLFLGGLFLQLETATRRKCAAREAEAGTAGKVRAFKHTEAEIEEKLKELAARRTTEALVHEQTVTFLKQRQEELTAQAAEWAEKFATDTEAKEAELKSLQTLREADLETLNELQVCDSVWLCVVLGCV